MSSDPSSGVTMCPVLTYCYLLVVTLSGAPLDWLPALRAPRSVLCARALSWEHRSVGPDNGRPGQLGEVCGLVQFGHLGIKHGKFGQWLLLVGVAGLRVIILYMEDNRT